MKKHFIQFQLLIISVLLLVTLILMMAILQRYNHRWDLTPQKLYSLSETTTRLLDQLDAGPVEVIAFYPHNDPQKTDFEIFLKECAFQSNQFSYTFHDPNKRPQLARYWNVSELYTVVIRYLDHHERAVLPNEEAFAEALMRLLNPKEIKTCVVTEAGDLRFNSKEPEGFGVFTEVISQNHFTITKLTLENQSLPEDCDLMLVLGPRSDWSESEVGPLMEAYKQGKGVLWLMDPMDPGTGLTFVELFKPLGVRLGEDVVVDRMSQMVGGDFLLPLVNQYDPGHPVTAGFQTALFFPVARTVRPLPLERNNYQVTSLAMTGSNSWAETNLQGLSSGEAVFEIETDMPGPLSLAVAIEALDPAGQESAHRMIIIGDSDFISNAYMDLSSARDFIMRVLRWLAKDERVVRFEHQHGEFTPLLLNEKQRMVLIVISLAGYPIFFLILGMVQIFLRKRHQ